MKKRLDVNRKELKEIANILDQNGSEAVVRILRHIDSDDLTYTSKLAKELKYTWANTKEAVDKLLRWGFVKKYQYTERIYGNLRRLDNVKGLILTKRGYMAKVIISKNEELYELKNGRIRRIK